MVVHKMEYPYFLFTSLLLVGLSSPHGNLDPITWKPLVIVDYPKKKASMMPKQDHTSPEAVSESSFFSLLHSAMQRSFLHS